MEPTHLSSCGLQRLLPLPHPHLMSLFRHHQKHLQTCHRAPTNRPPQVKRVTEAPHFSPNWCLDSVDPVGRETELQRICPCQWHHLSAPHLHSVLNSWSGQGSVPTTHTSSVKQILFRSKVSRCRQRLNNQPHFVLCHARLLHLSNEVRESHGRPRRGRRSHGGGTVGRRDAQRPPPQETP